MKYFLHFIHFDSGDVDVRFNYWMLYFFRIKLWKKLLLNNYTKSIKQEQVSPFITAVSKSYVRINHLWILWLQTEWNFRLWSILYVIFSGWIWWLSIQQEFYFSLKESVSGINCSRKLRELLTKSLNPFEGTSRCLIRNFMIQLCQNWRWVTIFINNSLKANKNFVTSLVKLGFKKFVAANVVKSHNC